MVSVGDEQWRHRVQVFSKICRTVVWNFHHTGQMEAAWCDSSCRGKRGERVRSGSIEQQGRQGSAAEHLRHDRHNLRHSTAAMLLRFYDACVDMPAVLDSFLQCLLSSFVTRSLFASHIHRPWTLETSHSTQRCHPQYPLVDGHRLPISP